MKKAGCRQLYHDARAQGASTEVCSQLGPLVLHVRLQASFFHRTQAQRKLTVAVEAAVGGVGGGGSPWYTAQGEGDPSTVVTGLSSVPIYHRYLST